MEPGTARGQWARPAPAPCHLHPSSVAHPHELQTCTHSPAFSLGLSLLNTGAPLPPSSYSTPNLPMCLSVSRSITLPLAVSHTGMLLFLRCPLRGCLRTDIYGPGRTGGRKCACAGIDPTRRQSRSQWSHEQ